jgi:hypothetical protein
MTYICHKIYIFICMFILMNLNTYVITFHVADIPTFRLRSPVMAYCMCTYFIKVFSVYNILYIRVLPTIFQNDDFVSAVVSWVFLIGSLTCTLCPILIWVDIRRFVMYMKKWLQFQVPNNCVITFIFTWDRLSEIKEMIHEASRYCSVKYEVVTVGFLEACVTLHQHRVRSCLLLSFQSFEHVDEKIKPI